jgi:PAS domain S-box-containing protein
VIKSPHKSRRFPAWLLALLLLIVATLGVSAATPKRVLILDPFGRNVAPFTTAVSSFRTTLARELGEPVDIYELPLELTRFSGPEGETPLVTFVEGRLKAQSVDLVVSVGTAGMQFAARHRDQLFPNTPVLVLASEPRIMSPELLKTNATAVTQRVRLPSMVEDILQLRPQTTNIVMVLGASALERFWAEQCRREFQVFTNRVGFTWVNDLTLEQILKHCSTLPPNSFVLHALFIVDAAGVPCERNEALRRLHEVANAPVFGFYTSEFGLGSIGGRLFQDTEVGAQAALTAVRILRGERPEHIPPQIMEATAPIYDWRELRRWGISESRLPAGSVIQFRQPTFWERYHWLVIGTSLFCFLQAALIVGLWVNRAKRKQGEAEATLLAEISSKFVNLPPGEVDLEIEDALRRICESLDLDLATLWQWSDEAPGVFRFTHAYRAPGVPPTAEPSGQQQFPWIIGQVRAGRTVAIPSVEELPAEAAVDQANGRLGGIKSALAIPFSVGGEPPVGGLGLNSTRAERNWPDALVKRLEVVAQIFANALARKRTEQVLRENEQRMTLAADAAHFGIWVWNIAPNQVWGSERWQGLFGFVAGKDVSFEAVIGRIHPDDRETVEREVRDALANRGDYVGEFRAVLPDGTLRWIASRGRGYADANGTPIRMVGAAIDITERRQSEAALLRQRSELAHLSRVAMLGELSGSMAHELNQPLTAILSNAQAAQRFLAADEADLGEVRDILADIVSEDKRAGEIIRRLRLLLKKGEVQRQELNINEVVQEVLKLVRSDLVNHDVTMATELAPGLPVVHGDRVQLQQVLLNLVMNGCEAMASSEKNVRQLTIRTDRSEDGSVYVSVTDCGPGIIPERLEQVFESFYTTKPQGMGLGLTVCRTIITAHRGKLWANSKPGRGATVCFTLPTD